jgi:C-terminal processing protease CtpA/Prc
MSFTYVYTDAMDKVFIDAVSEESFRGYLRNFDNLAIAAVTEKLRIAAGDSYTFLYTPRQYEFTKDFEREIVKEALIKEVASDTVYIYIPSISKYTRRFVTDNKHILAYYENIIIDLQGNAGGTLDDMYAVANLFMERGQIIGYERTRIPITSRVGKASGRKELIYNNIVILLDSQTASACEGFIMAMKENFDNVTTIGTRSFGKGIGQYTLPLKRGFALKATTMLIETPSGGSVHNTGIEPDYVYDDEDIVGFAVGVIHSER